MEAYASEVSIVYSGESLCFNVKKLYAEHSRPQILDFSHNDGISTLQSKLESMDIDFSKTYFKIGVVNPHVLLRNIEEEISESYGAFEKLNPAFQGKYVMHMDLEDINLRCVFATSDGVKEKFESIISTNTKYFHLLPVILRDIVQEEEGLSRDHLRLHLSGNKICFIVIRDKKIRYYNVFEFFTPEDFLYFVTYVAHVNELSLYDTIVVFSGRLKSNGRIFDLLRKYIDKLEFSSKDDAYLFTDIRQLNACE